MAEEKKEKTALERFEEFTAKGSVSEETLKVLRDIIVEHENKLYVMQGLIEDMELEIRTLTNQLNRM